MGTEGLKIGQAKKWVTRILGKKKSSLAKIKRRDLSSLRGDGGGWRAEVGGEGTVLPVAGAQGESRGGW